MAIVTQSMIAQSITICKKLGVPHLLLPFTTINEVLDSSQGVPNQPSIATVGKELTDEYDPVGDTDAIRLRYLIIGNNGHQTIHAERVTAGIPTEIEHSVKDFGLYNIIPFIARPYGDDLTPTERQRYRLRKVIEVDGTLYVMYFALILPPLTASPTFSIYTVENGQTVGLQPFIPSNDELLPSHPVGDISSNNTHIAATIPFAVSLNEQETQEVASACNILFGSPELALISEIATCTGVEKSVLQRYPATGPQEPQATPVGLYYEAVAVQVDTHITTIQKVSEASTGLYLGMQIGAPSPLYPNASSAS